MDQSENFQKEKASSAAGQPVHVDAPALAAALEPDQARVLMALLTKPTITDAAAAAGVSVSTIYRLMQTETFSSELRRAQAELVGDLVRRLNIESGKSLDALISIRDDLRAGAGARVKAAETIMNFASKLNRDHTMMQELSEIREKMESKKRY